MKKGCCQYCEHNWDSECDCPPCRFIRAVGFEHERNCERAPLTQEEQEEVYGGPLPEGLTIRRFTAEEIEILDRGMTGE